MVTLVAPPGVPCDASLEITNTDGQVATAVFNPAPVINQTFGVVGPATGGGQMFILGNHFYPGTSVTIAGNPATIVSLARESLLVVAPPGGPGPATVLVSSVTGCTATTTYLYQGARP